MLKPYYAFNRIEAGCDEAGRGCLAGPVFAAAVILPKNFFHPLLNDSKLVSEKNRNILRTYIEENAISFSVSKVSEKKIDAINILQASILCMHQALEKNSISPELILVDGNRFYSFRNIPHKCVVKGDSKYASIAAASILAKTYRDEFMLKLHKSFPEYGWIRNKGYGTAEHLKALSKFGLTKYHRKSFRMPSNLYSI